MTNQRVEIITSVQRRRRWSAAEKEHLLAAALAPGASVSAVAREAGIHPSQLYGWRRQLRAPMRIGFAPVHLAPEAAGAGLADPASRIITGDSAPTGFDFERCQAFST